VKGTVKLGVTVSPGSGKFEICEHDSVVASGRISILEETEIPDNECSKPAEATEPLPLNSEDIYKELRLRGYEYGPTFSGILSADGTGKSHWFRNNGWNGLLKKTSSIFEPAAIIIVVLSRFFYTTWRFNNNSNHGLQVTKYGITSC